MKPIDGLDKLGALLRSRVGGTRAASGTRGTSPGAQMPQPGPQRPPAVALEEALRTRVRQLRQQRAEPEAMSLAMIGTMLAWEQNDALHNEPRFLALVQQVQRHIRNDPALDSAFQHIIEQLA